MVNFHVVGMYIKIFTHIASANLLNKRIIAYEKIMQE